MVNEDHLAQLQAMQQELLLHNPMFTPKPTHAVRMVQLFNSTFCPLQMSRLLAWRGAEQSVTDD